MLHRTSCVVHGVIQYSDLYLNIHTYIHITHTHRPIRHLDEPFTDVQQETDDVL